MTAVSAADEAEVANFYVHNAWLYHGTVRPTIDAVSTWLDARWFETPGTRTFWLNADGVHVGLVRLFDLDDGTPLFDLRLRDASRGLGLGTWAVRWLTRYVFDEFPGTDRIEATTRVDNVAMRRALEASGWVKESHWRLAWHTDGDRYDGVGYGVLRRDHLTGTTTPVRWNG